MDFEIGGNDSVAVRVENDPTEGDWSQHGDHLRLDLGDEGIVWFANTSIADVDQIFFV